MPSLADAQVQAWTREDATGPGRRQRLGRRRLSKLGLTVRTAVALGLLGALLGAGGCESIPSTRRSRQDDPVVATIDGQPLHQSVVQMLMRERGLSEEEASATALETLRLAAQYRREHATDADPSPSLESLLPAARVDQLRRSTLARIALREIFEAEHQLGDVPSRIIAEHIEDPAIFHPRLHLICHVIIVEDVEVAPGEIAFPPAKDADPSWWSGAQAQAARLSQALTRYVPDIGSEKDCEWTRQVMARMGPPPEGGRLRYKFETGAYESCNAEAFDPAFVAALCPVNTPGWVAPFDSSFGVHVVGVLKVLDDTRALKDDPSVRDNHLRALVLEDWRRAELDAWLARLREERIVSIADGPTGHNDGAEP